MQSQRELTSDEALIVVPTGLRASPLGQTGASSSTLRG